MKEYLTKGFQSVYNENPMKFYFSPGRINLIGEHIDYNGGNVFPFAIEMGIYASIKKRTDLKVRLYSENFVELGINEFQMNSTIEKTNDWTDYVKGMFVTLIKEGYNISNGFDFYIYGNLPKGSGLSSSASLEMLVGVILNDAFHLNISRVKLSTLAQKAENQYIGVSCGIMDQLAVGMGKKDQAILLNTSTLEYKYAPLRLGEYRIAILNTCKPRGLLDSKYNERREECEKALAILQKKYPIKALCELSLKELLESKELFINQEILYRRAHHVISEQERVTRTYNCLNEGNYQMVGQILNESHDSLKSDYEVSGLHLDSIVYIARSFDGVLGARMTGAGFGGCAIALVEEKKYPQFEEFVKKEYKEKTGIDCQIMLANAVDGTKKMEE